MIVAVRKSKLLSFPVSIPRYPLNFFISLFWSHNGFQFALGTKRGVEYFHTIVGILESMFSVFITDKLIVITTVLK